ncbi:MAG: ATP-dependent RecD-like DNA helicase [Bacillota bacterium]|nr:ATP-dependent RecD-like DNA helicase [Bacillota bacterium]
MIIDKKIYTVNDVINRNLLDDDRGFVSQNILSQLRNLVEYIIFRIYIVKEKKDIDFNYDDIDNAKNYIRTIGKYNFLGKFHNFLQMSASHYTFDEYNSEQLMLKYYSFLMDIKKLMNDEFDMTILENIYKFPLKVESVFSNYYKEIAKSIDSRIAINRELSYDSYYVQNIKPFYVNEEKYYEVTLINALENANKYDRIITFTKINIMSNYSIKIVTENTTINVLENDIEITIITNYQIAIRPCELNNLSYILNNKIKINRDNAEYIKLMSFMTDTNMNLIEIIDSNNKTYRNIRDKICKNIQKERIFSILDICRNISINNSPGKNVIRYLLYTMNNKVIKKQWGGICSNLSNLSLDNGCIPFDKMPFYYSLKGHNPKITDLLQCINLAGREHEILGRRIKNSIETKKLLYNNKKDLKLDNIDKLVQQYNDSLYYKHEGPRINNYKDYLYMNSYVYDTYNILSSLLELSKIENHDYKNNVNEWLDEISMEIDDEKKKEILLNLFCKSSVGIITGAAGTGKTTMMKYIAEFFLNKKKIFLAQTNTAVENMKQKINVDNSIFETVKKNTNKTLKLCDVLFIDECSTVSNIDMQIILRYIKFKYLVLVGDEMQIESIRFGNWFSLSKYFMPKFCLFELDHPYRAINNTNLMLLWDAVRQKKDNITELLVSFDCLSNLNQSIFDKYANDEIILCLNYDGLYGINNINRILQNNNENPEILWGIKKYKVGDPILFSDTKRYEPAIYNNIKGKIVEIETSEEQIIFYIEVFKKITDEECEQSNIELIRRTINNNPIIKITVKKYIDYDNDNEGLEMIVPFQVAYSISIHKAQGLEYKSVKIIIADDVYESVTHNIFYTAITRTTDHLKIYWSPETGQKIIESFKKNNKNEVIRDVNLLSNHMELKKQKNK